MHKQIPLALLSTLVALAATALPFPGIGPGNEAARLPDDELILSPAPGRNDRHLRFSNTAGV
jgi:hypothetical protein